VTTIILALLVGAGISGLTTRLLYNYDRSADRWGKVTSRGKR
jgi:hypothetical protein